jgi:CNT family concentrative nucleoside transporter
VVAHTPKSEAQSVVEAAANGAIDGLKLALNVGAMLLAFIALIAVADSVLGWFDQLIDGRLLGWLHAHLDAPWLRQVAQDASTGEFLGYFPGSLRTFFGTLLAPLAWLMGVPWKDASAVGNLLGIKLSVNEFVAYGLLAQELESLEPRSVVIATYALCGFANFSSIGIQIGGIGVLAPERRSELSRIGVRAMFGGALASWMTATVAGILL